VITEFAGLSDGAKLLFMINRLERYITPTCYIWHNAVGLTGPDREAWFAAWREIDQFTEHCRALADETRASRLQRSAKGRL
jgi:hypothetical protein